jgi:uncharacterized protein YprB with RNaseH-like and TPR domain
VSLEEARLGRRLDELRRERAGRGGAGGGARIQAPALPDLESESDPEVRRLIASIMAAADGFGPPQPVWRDQEPTDPGALASRLAAGLDGDAIETARGWYVRRELRPVYLPLDRERLAELPGMPASNAPLLCLDTETTGLGSAAGTVAFLVGVAWWEGDRMRLLQLALPDHSEEGALLEALRAETPAGAWLVSYNGRSFDWPLLETRFRMSRGRPPDLEGHLDLLLLVRRLFRHRLPDARLQTVERHLLRRHRAPDIPASEIPAIYHSFLRGGPVGPLRVVARHNAEDVVTLGRILAHLERGYGRGEVRRWAPKGDLVRLARLYRHEARVEEAVTCLELAGEGIESGDPDGALATVELARLLRREGRTAEAGVAWSRLVTAPGPIAALGWIELAKEREHRERNLAAAWAATDEALLALYRSRAYGNAMFRRALEADVAHRRERLARRLERARLAG